MQHPKDYDTRAKKIKLLQDLSTGKVSIDDVIPSKVEMWTKRGNQYTNELTGDVVDNEQYEAFKKTLRPKDVIFFTDLTNYDESKSKYKNHE